MIVAAGALGFLATVGRGIRASLRRRRILVSFGIFLGVCFLSVQATLPLLSAVVNHSRLACLFYLTILVRIGLLPSLVPLAYLLAGVRLEGRASAFVSLFPIMLLLIGYSVEALTTKRWHEWTARLSEPGQRVRQEILLPDHRRLRLSRWREAKVLMDMQGGPGKAYDLIVEVIGERVMEYHGGVQAPAHWIEDRGDFYRQRLQVQGREPEDLRQWFEIPVDLLLLTDTDRIVVDVYLTSSPKDPGDHVDMCGDYTWTEDGILEEPCFGLTRRETSIYRYVYDEFRLDCRTRLHSLQSASAFFDEGRWSHEDLSPALGRSSKRVIQDSTTSARGAQTPGEDDVMSHFRSRRRSSLLRR